MEQGKRNTGQEYGPHLEVITLDNPEGEYSIIYGRHDRPQNPDQLPKGLSALALERVYLGNDYWLGAEEKISDLMSNVQYSQLFPSIIEQMIPIFDLDIAGKSESVQDIFGYSMYLPPIIEGAAAVALYSKNKEKPTTRRNFLKKSGGLLASAYLAMPAASQVSMEIRASNPGLDRPIAEFVKLEQHLHPEDNVLALQARNRIYAIKEKRLMQLFPDHPNFGTVLGLAHVGFEDAIKNSLEENLDFLYKIKPALKVFLPASIHTAFKYDFDGSQWNEEIYTIPELKELADEVENFNIPGFAR